MKIKKIIRIFLKKRKRKQKKALEESLKIRNLVLNYLSDYNTSSTIFEMNSEGYLVRNRDFDRQKRFEEVNFEGVVQ